MKTKIKFLLDNGLSSNTLSKLNESKINLLYEKFKKMKKEETSENWTVNNQTTYTAKLPQVQNQKLQVPQGAKEISVSGDTLQVTETEMTEDVALNKLSKVNPNETGSNLPIGQNNPQDNNSPDVSGDNDGMPTEGEIKEKFESQAQRNFFWAKCNTSKGVKKQKWCEMAREFEDSTSEEQSETMPKKKHPEKTVKYKKKKTNEETQKFLENQILKMLEEEKRKQMKKKKSENMILKNPKKVTMFSDEAPMQLPLGKMFSIGFK